MSTRLLSFVQRLETTLSNSPLHWLHAICDAGMIHRIDTHHPILPETTERLQQEGLLAPALFSQIPLYELMIDFTQDLHNNLQRLDKLCAAAHWLQQTHVIEPYVEYLRELIHLDPQPWSCMTDVASLILEYTPPHYGDPARKLWITINSVPFMKPLPKDTVASISADTAEGAEIIQLFLPQLAMAADDGEDSTVETIDVWIAQNISIFIRIHGQQRHLIIQLFDEPTEQPVVKNNGVFVVGTLIDMDFEYPITTGRWEIQYQTSKIICEVKETASGQPTAKTAPQVTTPVTMEVIGIGGGACNVIDHMITSQEQRFTYRACLTDSRYLEHSKAKHQLLIGQSITNGLGCQAKPEIGWQAAEESATAIKEAIRGVDLAFIVACMG